VTPATDVDRHCGRLRRRRATRGLALALCLSAALCGAAAAQDAAAPAADAASPPATLPELVAQLASQSWADREAAERALEAMAGDVTEALDPLLARVTDPEALRRLERIYRHHAPQAAYAGRTPQPGFLGINMMVVEPDQDERLAGRRHGIMVNQVVEGTAAEAAGIKQADLIVTIDGEPFVGDITTDHFARRIQQIGVGGQVEVAYYRGDELHHVTVTLTSARGFVPAVPTDRQGLSPASEQEADPRVLAYRWRQWWRKHLEQVRRKYGPAAEAPEAGAAGTAPQRAAPQGPAAGAEGL
jgi:C-terminal processing protease CtpA/Prc